MRQEPPTHDRQPGFVSLVGAGPGSPDLITVRGLRALERAQVILPDALLEPEFSALYPPGALVMPVGKRGGGLGTPQEVINGMLVGFALRGLRVVRLKGGDPLMFGRGGEEALVLEEHGIPFEFIPGVSALHGAAASAGISLTHRGLARELRVLQGQQLLQGATDWAGLARSEATLAIFMGKTLLAEVALRLLEHGADPELPVALVENGTCRNQENSWGTLALAAQGRMPARTDGPGIIYLGQALRARSHPLHLLPTFAANGVS